MITYAEGPYLVTCLEHGFELAKSGKPMIVFKVGVEYQLRNEPDASGVISEQAIPVQRRWERTIWLAIVEDNQESLDYAMTKLRYAGFTGDKFEDLDLVGQQFRAECKHEQGEKGLREKWELPLPPRARREIKNDASLAKRLNALFGKRLSDGAVTPPPRPVTPNGAAAIDESDIPF